MPELTYEFGYFYALGLITAVGWWWFFILKEKNGFRIDIKIADNIIAIIFK